ncbi:MAG: sugar phosphate isomerase/epimerase [Bacteroidales bacterium]|nr:sugar phosphate isomerase/epimerase [Bacteroidales bacterium]MDT8372826.1 sugar phosphate isomerase/epimerase [Bacteroidales bacterium]
MTTRRDFMRQSALVMAAMPLLNNELLASGRSSKKTGLALYSIRDEMKKDPAAALAKAAAIGFDWVEAADHSDGKFYGFKPREFGKIVKKAGMEAISSHSNIRPENADKMIDEAAEAGMKYIIKPSLPDDWSSTLDGFRRSADFFNEAGEKCRKAGITFGFHNHQIEFREIDGTVPFDLLAENSDPRLVIFELDIAWITAAGKDPVAYFKKFPGRFPVWHMKDLSPEKQDATLGEGIIDFRPILAMSKKAGMEYWFIEQGNCLTHTPMESIAISRRYYLDALLK